MAFLIEQILEIEVGLVHLLPGSGGLLFARPGGGIGSSVEGL